MIKQEQHRESVQREKILNILKKETELFINYKRENGSYRSRKFTTLGLVINNPVFNITDHGKLIELVFEVKRIQDNVNNSVEVSNAILASSIGTYMKPSLYMIFIHFIEDKLLNKKEKTLDKVGKSIESTINKIMEDPVTQAEAPLQELYFEIERLLLAT